MNNRAIQALYRPAVKAAWLAHCDQTGSDSSDRCAQRAWYVATLDRIAGIQTTAGASAAQLETLLEAFSGMAESAEGSAPGARRQAPFAIPRGPDFSEKQQASFSKLVAKAWRRVQACDPSVDFEAWVNARMAEALGSSGASRFDRVMCLFAVIAGDEFWIARTAEAQERRIRHAIRAKLAELSRLTQRELDWSYVQGIHAQAGVFGSLDDCPAQHLRLILQMLGSAIAREMRKAQSA